MAKNQNVMSMSFVFDGSIEPNNHEAHLLPAGDFTPDDGRPLNVDSFKLSAAIAKNIIAVMAVRKNMTLIDYEHQSLRAEENGQKVIAAGWFKQMEYRDDGLWAVNIEWTQAALEHIRTKEYKYISAVFNYHAKTGEIVNIVSVALTNTPALDGLKALAALTKSTQDFYTGDIAMPDNKQDTELAALTTQMAKLTADLKTANEQVIALTADKTELTNKLAKMDEEKAQAALAAEKKAHADLLQTALTDGRVAPAQKAWAEKLNLAALTEYLEATTPLVPQGRQADPAHKDINHGLDEAELAMCSRMGVKPEEFAKTKQAELTRKQQAQA